MKKGLTILLALAVGILPCAGCTVREDPETALINYMNERYPDDTFTLCPVQLHWGDPYECYCLDFKSENIPDRSIYAARSLKDREYKYDDNYMKYYLEDETVAYICEMAGKYLGECKAYVGYSPWEGTLPSSFPTDATAEDILNSGLNSWYTVYVSPENITLGEARDIFKEFRTEFEGHQFENVSVYVYLVPNTELFEEMKPRMDSGSQHKYLERCSRVGGTSD